MYKNEAIKLEEVRLQVIQTPISAGVIVETIDLQFQIYEKYENDSIKSEDVGLESTWPLYNRTVVIAGTVEVQL